jgi:excisionase family DNA binding protein
VNELWTAAQVARRLGVSTDWVYRASREGLIPTISLGRYRRYRPDAIEKWVMELESGRPLSDATVGGGGSVRPLPFGRSARHA